MWWGIGLGALLWIILFVWLGLRTLRNGHGWMFFFGIFFPLLWIFGASCNPPGAGLVNIVPSLSGRAESPRLGAVVAVADLIPS